LQAGEDDDAGGEAAKERATRGECFDVERWHRFASEGAGTDRTVAGREPAMNPS
jgi:hypothetical protein